MKMNNKTRNVATAALSTVGLVAALAPLGSQAAQAATVRTIKGTAVKTPYGTVKVTIKVKGRTMTSITTVYPTDLAKSAQINRTAIPKLQAAALKAQSAKIKSVSGATYTSTGFKKSLASALAKR